MNRKVNQTPPGYRGYPGDIKRLFDVFSTSIKRSDVSLTLFQRGNGVVMRR